MPWVTVALCQMGDPGFLQIHLWTGLYQFFEEPPHPSFHPLHRFGRTMYTSHLTILYYSTPNPAAQWSMHRHLGPPC